MPRTLFPEGQEVDRRGEIEDALEEALANDNAGCFLGGAMGHDAVYIELLIFDGDRSKKLIQAAMNNQGLEGQYQFESFTK